MSETEEIKARLPIEQLVGGYVPLKKMGRVFKACCPFHTEKTPSFTVSPDRGIFKCFGCGKGGDVFDFVMEIDGLTFPEAVKLLAERTGVELKEFKSSPESGGGTNQVSKARLFSLNSYAAKLWHTILVKHPKAESARLYLNSRDIHDQAILDFQIGYAPLGSTTELSLRKAGYTPLELGSAGNPAKFQDRITFPITDITGRIVGFTGRLLELKTDPQASRGPKYWNTPETALFVKSRIVYALHLAKRAIQEEDLSLLVEGQMDVVALHQAGFKNAVASSGTALTIEQVKLLGRFSENICFAYDQDRAGIEATKRGIELVLSAELNPYVITVPKGKDPAECLQKNPEAWQDAYTGRQPFMTWLIDQALAENPDLTPIGKKKLVQELLPWLVQVKDPLEQNEWIRWLSSRLQTEEKNLILALARTGKSAPSRKPTETLIPPLERTHKNMAELAVALLLSFPSLWQTLFSQRSSLELAAKTPFLKLLLPLLAQASVEQDLTSFLKQQLSEQQQKEISLYIQELLQKYQEVDLDEQQALEEFFLITARLRTEAKDQAKNELAAQIHQAQQMKDSDRLKELFSQLKNLI